MNVVWWSWARTRQFLAEHCAGAGRHRQTGGHCWQQEDKQESTVGGHGQGGCSMGSVLHAWQGVANEASYTLPQPLITRLAFSQSRVRMPYPFAKTPSRLRP